MKVLKKIMTYVLVLAMVVSVISINPTETNAKVTIKSKKKVTLVVKKTSKIKVKQKGAKFTSSNKKIATVNKKGKITAKKPGTCKITVKVKKSKKKVTVKVIPANVTGLTAKNLTDKGVQLKWSSVKYATGYTVYYSTSSTGGFKSVKIGKTTTYVLNNLNPGSTYYFKVKANVKSGNKTYSSAKYSSVVSEKVRKLVWNDEFNGKALDTTKWNNDGATGAGGYGNNELQNYQMDYCEVKDGNLLIKPQFEYNPKTKRVVNGQIFSTKLWTRNQYSFTYGKVEFRAKLPKGQGTWAACWMLGNQSNYGAWPKCGEIDILETTKDASKTMIPQSIHTQKYNGMPTSLGNKHEDTVLSTATSAYHTYGIIWTSNKITFTIDGKETWTYDPSRYGGTGNKDVWPYDKPFYLIINCAVGGTLGGQVGTNYWTKVGTKTYDSGAVNDIYQDKMYVDWVRVYQ